MNIITKPTATIVGSTNVNLVGLQQFLDEHNANDWQTDASHPGEKLSEVAGRLCYMSFFGGRKTNNDYLKHIIEVGHGSVLEHASWNFIITGVSRSLTHELVRHRVGMSYSQLSQRYVDESQADFIEPTIIAEDQELHAIWMAGVETAQGHYITLVNGLAKKLENVSDKTLRRKMARQAARSILPNACETKVFVTANARSLRHFFELRGSVHADTEIRALAITMLKAVQKEAPAFFSDYVITTIDDGTEICTTNHMKV